jgi:hypothetical protein
MPLYHFDLIRNGTIEVDDAGTEVGSDEEAIDAAARGLAELLTDHPGVGRDLGYAVRLDDAVICEVVLTVATSNPRTRQVHGEPAHREAHE